MLSELGVSTCKLFRTSVLFACTFSHQEAKSAKNIGLRSKEAVFVVSVYLPLSIPDEAKVIFNEQKVKPSETKSIQDDLNSIPEDVPHIRDNLSAIRDVVKNKCKGLMRIPFVTRVVPATINDVDSSRTYILAERKAILDKTAYIGNVINGIADRAENIPNG